MSNYKQENITICKVIIPTIIKDSVRWYPISYVYEKILLKNQKSVHKKYNEYIIKASINYSYLGTCNNVQNVKCINEDGLKLLLNNVRVSSLDKIQKKNLNELKQYFGLNIINYNKVNKLNDKNYKNIICNYNEFIQDCIKGIINEYPKIKWQQCTRCGNTYPLHKNFFHKDFRSHNFDTVCLDCLKANTHVCLDNKQLTHTYYNYGLEIYKTYKNHDTIQIYKHYKNIKINKIPKIIKNKEDYLKIIKYYYDLGEITKDNITSTLLCNNYGLKMIGYSTFLTMKDIYKFLFGEKCYCYPWKYKNLKLNKITYQNGKIIFNNYLKEKNITINDIFKFDYANILTKARLTQFENNILEFIVNYHELKYGGYLFKSHGVNYYKSKENRMFDMKYFIEKDLKIPIDKIPLYITKNVLRQKCRSLYHILHSRKYYKNLFEWINECYPNKFIEADFVINPYRCEFDSTEESQIHDIFRNNFKNVIYNQRNTDNTAVIQNMTPDWIILTHNNCWLIEYYGLYIEGRNGNKRIDDYIYRTNIKINKYKELIGYKHLFLYPEDLQDNFKKLKEKIKTII